MSFEVDEGGGWGLGAGHFVCFSLSFPLSLGALMS